MLNEIFTVQETAKILKLSPGTIRKWIREDKIYAYMIGEGRKSGYRIPIREIERLQRM